MFNQNGNTGYVLKPSYMQEGGTSNIPKGYDLSGESAPVVADYTVSVLAAHGLTTEAGKSIRKAKAVIRVDGCDADATKLKGKSSRVKKGVVSWDSASLQFSMRRPETAVVTIEVLDVGLFTSKVTAYYGFNLGAANEGKHEVQMWRTDSTAAKGMTITVEISKETKTTESSESEEEGQAEEAVGAEVPSTSSASSATGPDMA